MVEEALSGVLVVDKPCGPTSHDVVARVRRALRTKRVGHAGTLDPMATGVLVVAVGEATKLVPWLTADDKAYEATLRLGVATDTLDAEGVPTETRAVPEDVRRALADVARGAVASATLARALERERARTEQVPPAFSAIRVGGARAHDLARRGEAPALAARAVAVRTLAITGADVEGDRVTLSLTLEVQKGYFVRALARDLADALGTVGHLTALRRTRSGAFQIGEALALSELGRAREALVPLASAAARALPITVLDDAGVRAARDGQRVPPLSMRDPHAAPSAWLDEGGALVAVGEAIPDGTGQVLRGFGPRGG